MNFTKLSAILSTAADKGSSSDDIVGLVAAFGTASVSLSIQFLCLEPLPPAQLLRVKRNTVYWLLDQGICSTIKDVYEDELIEDFIVWVKDYLDSSLPWSTRLGSSAPFRTGKAYVKDAMKATTLAWQQMQGDLIQRARDQLIKSGGTDYLVNYVCRRIKLAIEHDRDESNYPAYVDPQPFDYNELSEPDLKELLRCREISEVGLSTKTQIVAKLKEWDTLVHSEDVQSDDEAQNDYFLASLTDEATMKATEEQVEDYFFGLDNSSETSDEEASSVSLYERRRPLLVDMEPGQSIEAPYTLPLPDLDSDDSSNEANEEAILRARSEIAQNSDGARPVELWPDDTAIEYIPAGSRVPRSNFCVRLRPLPEDCGVCREEITDVSIEEGEVAVAWCGHLFHSDCLDDWVNESAMAGANKCPTCRRTLCEPRQRAHEAEAEEDFYD